MYLHTHNKLHFTGVRRHLSYRHCCILIHRYERFGKLSRFESDFLVLIRSHNKFKCWIPNCIFCILKKKIIYKPYAKKSWPFLTLMIIFLWSFTITLPLLRILRDTTHGAAISAANTPIYTRGRNEHKCKNSEYLHCKHLWMRECTVQWHDIKIWTISPIS